MKARIRVVLSQMTTYRFYFGLVLLELILRHTDQLSKPLENLDLDSMEGHFIAMLTVKTLQTIHTNFNLFWNKVEMQWMSLIDEPGVEEYHGAYISKSTLKPFIWPLIASKVALIK